MPSVAISQGAAGTAHVVPAASVPAGMFVRVKAFWGCIGTTGTIQFKSSGGTALTGVTSVAAGQTVAVGGLSEHDEGWFESLTGEGIDLISATGAFNGSLTYYLCNA